jgi:hypothetical protein
MRRFKAMVAAAVLGATGLSTLGSAPAKAQMAVVVHRTIQGHWTADWTPAGLTEVLHPATMVIDSMTLDGVGEWDGAAGTRSTSCSMTGGTWGSATWGGTGVYAGSWTCSGSSWTASGGYTSYWTPAGGPWEFSWGSSPTPLERCYSVNVWRETQPPFNHFTVHCVGVVVAP